MLHIVSKTNSAALSSLFLHYKTTLHLAMMKKWQDSLMETVCRLSGAVAPVAANFESQSRLKRDQLATLKWLMNEKD